MPSDVVIVDTPSFFTYRNSGGEDVMRGRMNSNYTNLCRGAGILYLHNLSFRPVDPNMRVSTHLDAFRRTCRQHLIPSIIHIVPTLFWPTLTEEGLRMSMVQLQHQADANGALLHNPSDGRPFDGHPKAAWDVLLKLLSSFPGTSLATSPCIGSSNLNPGSERAVSISPRGEGNDESAQPTKSEVAENDYVIFVVGQTGAGKTWFTRQLSKNRDVGGHPDTKDVEVWRYSLDNGPANIMVIDTPSFHTGRNGVNVENTIADWLKSKSNR
ncbi:hypothetical protein EDD16DRAFT_1640155 [Pisolithus croceorrhizus]|nr:hypothetical protein EDD16DRAFT_1640155 [Pisolithus croceorrhizus]